MKALLMAFMSWLFALFQLLSPLTLSAAEHGVEGAGPEPQWIYIVFHVINLCIALYIIYFYARKPLRDYLIRRQDSVRDVLEKAEAEKVAAEEMKMAYEARIAALDGEMAAFRQEVETKAREDASRILENAKAAVARTQQETQRLLNDELERSRQQLRRETVTLAIELAEKLLVQHINEADQQRLAPDYLKRVVQSTEIN